MASENALNKITARKIAEDNRALCVLIRMCAVQASLAALSPPFV
jgi:hypothetical protein